MPKSDDLGTLLILGLDSARPHNLRVHPLRGGFMEIIHELRIIEALLVVLAFEGLGILIAVASRRS